MPPASQTLHRGLLTLELVAGSPTPMTVADVAAGLGLHRSVAYRMLRTLEDHRLVWRTPDNRYAAGAGLSVLARPVVPTLQSAALSELPLLANAVGMTAFLVVLQEDEAVTVTAVEPRHSEVHVSYRPGTRHRADRGAPGLALLAGDRPLPDERPEVTEARARGWVVTHAEVLPGMWACASPVVDASGACAGAVCVVFVGGDHVDLPALGDQVSATAKAVAAHL
jgi:DNA-binding IclR family transcriptional regulator